MNDVHNTSNKFHAILFADVSNLTHTLWYFDVNLKKKSTELNYQTASTKQSR